MLDALPKRDFSAEIALKFAQYAKEASVISNNMLTQLWTLIRGHITVGDLIFTHTFTAYDVSTEENRSICLMAIQKTRDYLEGLGYKVGVSEEPSVSLNPEQKYLRLTVSWAATPAIAVDV